MDDEARRNLRESFAADMAEHQRMTGHEVSATANERLAVPMFERLEQKQTERAQRPARRASPDPISDDEHRRALATELERRGRPGALERMRIERYEDREPVRVRATRREMERAERIQARLDLLLGLRESGPLGQPSWRDRALAVLSMRFVIGMDRRRIAQELIDLVEASTLSLGPWDVPAGAGRPILFT
jgi:hypothetical protein